MGKHDEIRASLARFSAKHGPQPTLLGTVVSIDEDAFTCVINDGEDDGINYEGVRLRPVLDGNESVTVFPKQGTWALAVRIENDEEWMVIAVGEADKVRMVIGTCTFEIQDGFLVQRGAETLKKIFDDLFTAIKAITVPTNSGPSGVPLNGAAFDGIKTRVDNLLK